MLGVGCNVGEFLRGGSGTSVANKAVDVSAYPAARPESSARVHELGEALLAQNPFLGVEPVFYVVGRSEPEVYHPDGLGLLVTQGMVDACKTDEELTAVLALELGKMSAEARNAKRLGGQAAPDVGRGSSANGSAGGGPDDIQLRNEAIYQQVTKRQAKPEPAQDALTIAEQIADNAALPRGTLTATRKRLAEIVRATPIADQMTRKGDAPTWSRGSAD
jgi:hypothetical protein